MKKCILVTLILLLMLGVIGIVFYGLKDNFNFSTDKREVEKNDKKQENNVLNLYGEWKQTNSNSNTAYFIATINEDETMIINWYTEEDNTKALYWAGTFTPPTEKSKSYTWISKNDKEQTSNALFASEDETKEFKYKDGIISYEASTLGVTITTELERNE